MKSKAEIIKNWTNESWTVGQYTPSSDFKTIQNHSCVCRPDLSLISLSGPAEDLESQLQSDLMSQSPKMYLLLQEVLTYHLHPTLRNEIEQTLKKAIGE